jgi:ABC-type uncharacterized transport system involved in gliding motility auxiliary subunit
MMNKLMSGAGLLLALIALIAVNVFSNISFTGARLDLTENGAFTLTEGTRNTIARIDEPVTLRLFLSERIARETPSVTTYANRVRDMLVEYQRRGGDNIRLEIIDPEPFSEDEDRAVGYGLHAIPLGDEGTNFYFGLVGTNSTDDEIIVPYLNMEREAFLEYDLTKVLWQLLDTKTPVAAVISALPIHGMNQQQAMMMGGAGTKPWMIVEQADQTFDLQTLDLQVNEISADVDVLMVVHPKGLGLPTLYAIDQFVMRGGRLLMFVDPFAEADRPTPMVAQMGGFVRASNPDKLFEAWGIGYDPTKFVGDLQHALTVRFQREGKLITTEYPAWIDLPQNNLSDTDATTSNVGKLVFGSAGALSVKDGSSLKMVALASSSDQAMLMDVSEMDPQRSPADILGAYKPGGEALVVAARFVGDLKSAFPDGPPIAAPKGDGAQPADPAEKSAHLTSTTAPANLIIVADTDMLEDRFWVQVQELLGSRMAVPTAGNGDFAINALDNLTGSNDLISVRSRGRFARPFLRVNEIRQAAEVRFRAKEQQLTDELNSTEAKLVRLETAKPGGGAGGDNVVLSEAQEDEIERFRKEKVRVRKELREVLHERRKNINDLEFNLRMLNIGLMPLFIILAGILVAFWQVQRRRRGAMAARSA